MGLTFLYIQMTLSMNLNVKNVGLVTIADRMTCLSVFGFNSRINELNSHISRGMVAT